MVHERKAAVLSWVFHEFLTRARGWRYHHFVMGSISPGLGRRDVHAGQKSTFLSYACVALGKRGKVRKAFMLKLKLMAVPLIGCMLLSYGIFLAQVPNATDQASDVYDGFETTTLSKMWDTSRFVPGAVTMQSDIVRAGHGAAKIVVHANDKYEAGIKGNRPTERAELMEARKLVSPTASPSSSSRARGSSWAPTSASRRSGAGRAGRGYGTTTSSASGRPTSSPRPSRCGPSSITTSSIKKHSEVFSPAGSSARGRSSSSASTTTTSGTSSAISSRTTTTSSSSSRTGGGSSHKFPYEDFSVPVRFLLPPTSGNGC